MNIAVRLRDARITSGYKTAKAFAVCHKIPVSTYSMHETGRRGLRLEVAKRYCALLNIKLNWLLTGET